MENTTQNTKQIFHIFGYHEDYYLITSNNRKQYIGSVSITPDTERVNGYQGRKTFTANQNITIGKKTIKKGQQYITEQIPLCGKMINPVNP